MKKQALGLTSHPLTVRIGTRKLQLTLRPRQCALSPTWFFRLKGTLVIPAECYTGPVEAFQADRDLQRTPGSGVQVKFLGPDWRLWA